jgi:hypothetical protein
MSEEKQERPTLSGVDEKPQRKAPVIRRLPGLFVLLRVDRTPSVG